MPPRDASPLAGWARSGLRPLVILAVDGAVAALSLWLAMALRFEGSIPPRYAASLLPLLALLVPIRMVVGSAFRLHRWSFRFSGLADAARVGMACAAGSVLFVAASFLLVEPGPPRSVIVLELLLSTLLMASLRFAPRLAGLYVEDWKRSRRRESLRTIIVGAGAAGEMLLRDLQRSRGHDYQIVGFVDDDRAKHGNVVGGKTVLGPLERLPDLVRRHRVDQVLIAIPRLPGRKIRDLLSLCADLKLRFKILPVSFTYFSRRAASSMMQDLSPADLLPRDPIHLGAGDASPCAGRTALVTGAAGSIGSEICVQLLRGGARRVALVDQSESGLYMLQLRLRKEFPEANIATEVADIRDPVRMAALFERHRPQDVFHAAAHKHVPLMEAAPCEAVKTNVLGTRNVAELAHAHRAERFVLISTDKAVRPSSVMGASKRVCEALVRDLDARSDTRFCAVRFGNVLGSSGSVVPIFREQIAQGGPVTVTHPDVRRYFMTISEAVSLVLHAGYADYGPLCVLDMGEQIRIVDLARHLITMAGLAPDVDVPIRFTGLRPGEKLYEELLTEEEERTRRVHDKILVAGAEEKPDRLARRIRALVEAALAQDDEAVRTGLRELVPSYREGAAPVPVAADAPRAAGDGETVQ